MCVHTSAKSVFSDSCWVCTMHMLLFGRCHSTLHALFWVSVITAIAMRELKAPNHRVPSQISLHWGLTLGLRIWQPRSYGFHDEIHNLGVANVAAPKLQWGTLHKHPLVLECRNFRAAWFATPKLWISAWNPYLWGCEPSSPKVNTEILDFTMKCKSVRFGTLLSNALVSETWSHVFFILHTQWDLIWRKCGVSVDVSNVLSDYKGF